MKTRDGVMNILYFQVFICLYEGSLDFFNQFGNRFFGEAQRNNVRSIEQQCLGSLLMTAIDNVMVLDVADILPVAAEGVERGMPDNKRSSLG